MAAASTHSICCQLSASMSLSVAHNAGPGFQTTVSLQDASWASCSQGRPELCSCRAAAARG